MAKGELSIMAIILGQAPAYALMSIGRDGEKRCKGQAPNQVPPSVKLRLGNFFFSEKKTWQTNLFATSWGRRLALPYDKQPGPVAQKKGTGGGHSLGGGKLSFVGA